MGKIFQPLRQIESIRVMRPDPRLIPDFTICDPACGTGGFLVCAYEWLMEQSTGALERKDIKRIKAATYFGQDLVPRPRRLALMNLFLQAITELEAVVDDLKDILGLIEMNGEEGAEIGAD